MTDKEWETDIDIQNTLTKTQMNKTQSQTCEDNKVATKEKTIEKNKPIHNMICINRNITFTITQKMHNCEQIEKKTYL